MPQTRISDDVWQLGQQVATRMGLSTPREAIEAIVRVCADHYPHLGQSSAPSKPAPTMPTAPAVSAQDALSSLMQGL